MRSKSQPRRGLAMLELVLALPILLFIMALIYNAGVISAWKVRENGVARLAVWESRWPRSGPTRPSYWPATATMEASDQGNVAAMDDSRVDLPVARGPLQGATVNSELLDPTRGLREGLAEMKRRCAYLPKMGEYPLNAQTWLIDDKWQYQTPKMGMGNNWLRRIPVIYYPLAAASRSLVNAYTQAVMAVESAPFRPQLAPLDSDPDFIYYSWFFGGGIRSYYSNRAGGGGGGLGGSGGSSGSFSLSGGGFLSSGSYSSGSSGGYSSGSSTTPDYYGSTADSGRRSNYYGSPSDSGGGSDSYVSGDGYYYDNTYSYNYQSVSSSGGGYGSGGSGSYGSTSGGGFGFSSFGFVGGGAPDFEPQFQQLCSTDRGLTQQSVNNLIDRIQGNSAKHIPSVASVMASSFLGLYEGAMQAFQAIVKQQKPPVPGPLKAFAQSQIPQLQSKIQELTQFLETLP